MRGVHSPGAVLLAGRAGVTAERRARISIATPEGVTFSYALAGPVSRFAAWMLDSALMAAASNTLGQVLNALGFVTREWGAAIGTLGYFVISIGYGIFFEWRWRGQTIGKRVMQIRVMDAEGLRLTFQQIVIRNLLRPVDALPVLYLVGGGTMLLTKSAQRLGDVGAGTVVVREANKDFIIPDHIRTGKFNTFASYPHLVARLRQKAPLPLVEIAVNALERREEFDAAARVELFRELAERLKGLVEFPEEARVYLTDEQYVRGLVDEITKTRRSEIKVDGIKA